MGRTIAGEHFYGPTSPDAVDVPPRLGALCVVACVRRDGGAADLAVVDRAPAPAWRLILALAIAAGAASWLWTKL